MTDRKDQAQSEFEKVMSEGADAVVRYDSESKPHIRHDPGRLPEIVDALGSALTQASNLFVNSGRLVRVYEAPGGPGSGIKRQQGALIIHPIEAPHLVELSTTVAGHERFDSRTGDYKTIDCPRRICEAYLARGNWPELPTLSGFVEAPTVTLEWRLIDRAGYDKETGLYLAFDASLRGKPIPAKPSKGDAQKALQTLLTLIEDFPCVSDADRAAAVAGIITALVRRSLPSAPMLAITAPTPGTGKTMLAETPAIIATGRRASVLSLGHDDAEQEKRLGGVLLAGDACILLDNIERPLGGDLLCQVTTQPSVRLRPLGASSVVSVPTHSLLLATGNNLSIVGDLKRRVLLVRLDAQLERPELRKFNRNHFDYVLAHRAELIRAALVIILAYRAADCPAIDDLAPFGSFEDWDRMVRRPLVWLGLLDPLQAAEGLRDDDPDLANMRSFYSAWKDAFGEKAVTVAEIIDVGLERMPIISEPVSRDLYDSLQAVCAEKPNARRLGNWLRTHRNRRVDGMCLEQAGMDGKAKVAKWRIVK